MPHPMHALRRLVVVPAATSVVSALPGAPGLVAAEKSSGRAQAGSPPWAGSASFTLEQAWCPECSSPAEIVDRFVVESTNGPVEEIKLHCLERHWFLLPVSYLERN